MEITGPGTAELRKLASVVASADVRAREETRSKWRDLIGHIADQQEATINAAPSAGGEPYHQEPGLRRQIAGTVRIYTRLTADDAQAGVVSYGNKMPEGKDHLPQLADQGAWRHPLFGNRDHWYPQVLMPGWFSRPAARATPAMQLALLQVVIDVAKAMGG